MFPFRRQLLRIRQSHSIFVLAAIGAASTFGQSPSAQLSTLNHEQIASRRSEAYEQQKNQQWCDAKELWERLLTDLHTDAQFKLHRQEAEQNLRLLEPLCQPKKVPVSEREVPELEPEKRPEEVSVSDLLKFYPERKMVRSLMISNATGRGTNAQWVLEGEKNFAYQSRVATESKVTANTGKRLTLEVHFREVAQTLAVSNYELQFRELNQPLLEFVWEKLEDEILRNVPAYVAARKFAGIAAIVDPRGKRSLTWFGDQLRQAGLPIDGDEDIQFIASIDRLSGLRLQVEYVSGLGITHIKVLDGQTFDPDDLERLAYNLSVLMDYHIFPGAAKEPGQRWNVRAEDIAGMVNFGYGVDVQGQLNLERASDREKLAVLRITSGEVKLLARDQRVTHESTVTTRTGTVYYSNDDLLVREARIAWHLNTLRLSTDHLLFGTENIRNAKVETHYEAEQVRE